MIASSSETQEAFILLWWCSGEKWLHLSRKRLMKPRSSRPPGGDGMTWGHNCKVILHFFPSWVLYHVRLGTSINSWTMTKSANIYRHVHSMVVQSVHCVCFGWKWMALSSSLFATHSDSGCTKMYQSPGHKSQQSLDLSRFEKVVALNRLLLEQQQYCYCVLVHVEGSQTEKVAQTFWS